MTTFVVWNDGEGNSNLDPPPGVTEIQGAHVRIEGPDGEGDETIVIQYAEGRVTFQLEPERVQRLFEILRSAGAHPSGLGSYEAASDALTLLEDLRAQVEM